MRIVETEDNRKRMVAKVKIAQGQLGLDDETYRDVLENITGKRSAAKLKCWELDNVIKHLVKKGFKPTRPKRSGTTKKADDAQSKLITSLWIQLHEAGKVRDPSQQALVNFAKAQFKSTQGIEAIQWLDNYQKSKIIESLKKWLHR